MRRDAIYGIDAASERAEFYEGSVRRLGKAARRAIDNLSPVASAAAVYELEILYELGGRASPAQKN